MDSDQLRGLLEQVHAGAVDVDAALDQIRHLPFEDLGYAKLDHHRLLRHGLTEVVFGKGKTPEQIGAIAGRLLDKSANLLVTRADRDAAALLKAKHPDAEHFPLSGAVRIWRDRTVRGKGKLAIVCAGTSDIPIAEEAQVTAEVMGNEVEAIYDVGVAGIHRLIASQPTVDGGARDRGGGRYGRSASQRGGRPGFGSGDCGADQRRLWRELQRSGSLARDVEQLRQ